MKSALLALGLATAFLASAAHSSPLTASSGTTHFSSGHSTVVQASARKGKSAKHAKTKRHHRAVKKA